MIGRGIVLVHGFLDHAEAQGFRIEIVIAGGIGGDGGEVVQAIELHFVSYRVQPLGGDCYVVLGEIVSGRQRFMLHIGMGILQHGGQQLCIAGRDDRIAGAGNDEYRFLRKIGLRRFCERHHGAQQNGSAQGFGAEQKNGSGDVGPIGKANGNGLCQTIGLARFDDEIGQLVSALDHILLVEHAFCETPEKAGHAVFQYLATRRKQRAVGRQGFAQGQQIVFVAAGSVQQEKGCGRGSAGFKTMNK